MRVSYLEIYNEDVRDLLRQDQSVRLEVKERPDVGVYVKDLITHVVHNADEMDKIMTLGNKNSKLINIIITIDCQSEAIDGVTDFSVLSNPTEIQNFSHLRPCFRVISL